MKKLSLFLAIAIAMVFGGQIMAQEVKVAETKTVEKTAEVKAVEAKPVEKVSEVKPVEKVAEVKVAEAKPVVKVVKAKPVVKVTEKKPMKKDIMVKFDFFNRTRFLGNKVDDADWGDKFTQKTIFGMKAMKKGMGMAVFQLRNTSLLGTGYGNGYNSDGLSVYQAYGQFKLPFGVHSCLYFGRKIINIDTQYIFGSVGFHDVGKTFDTAGIKMNFMEKKLKLNIFHVRQSEKDASSTIEGVIDPDTGEDKVNYVNDEILNTIHLRYDLNKMMGFSFLYINDMTTITETDKSYMSHLLGLRANGKMPMGLSFNFEAYYQMGDDITIGAGKASDKSVSAYAVLLDLAFSLKDISVKPTFGVLFNLNSGDDDTTDDTNKNFLVAMGTKHKFFGYMDKYLNPGHWGGQGILNVNPYIKWTCAFHKNLKFKLDYHYFMPMVKVNDADKQSLGMEVDLTAKLKINDLFSFVGIFGYFVPGDLQKDAKIIADKEMFAYGAFQVKF